MSLKFEIRGSEKNAKLWSDGMSQNQKTMALAATAAYRDAGDAAKLGARTNIASAGFSKKWQNALRMAVYPKAPAASLRPAIQVWHKIPYSNVFETGAHITPEQNLLWLPVTGLPTSANRERITPITFERLTGQDLTYFRDPNTGTPVLGVQIKTNAKGPTKLSLTRLRRGANGKTGVLNTVPVFVGIRSVDIPRKFAIGKVMDDVAGSIPGRYVHYMKEATGG